MTKRKQRVLLTIAILLLLLLGTASVYIHFGGFGSGECADVEEFGKYTGKVEDIQLPDSTRMVALGEATHGNKEFQQLKLEVFKVMVEKYGVRAFALEADYGCCLKANEYVQGGDGTADEAAAALGFHIYRTREMAELLTWMRDYNSRMEEKLVLYGFDMQNIETDYRYLVEIAESLGVDTCLLVNTCDKKQTIEARRSSLQEVKGIFECLSSNEALKAVHLTDILLQYLDLEVAYKTDMNSYGVLRDSMMAENTLWIMSQEELRGNRVIFVSGHNGHIEQRGCYNGGKPVMGNVLADKIGEERYFAIGTDFYKTRNNMPKNNGERTTFTAYSRDPLAKAASGYDICWLDFSKIDSNSSIRQYVDGYINMGSLGENQISLLNRIVMSLLPNTYRVWRCPKEMYDGMIFVANGHPTIINIKCID